MNLKVWIALLVLVALAGAISTPVSAQPPPNVSTTWIKLWDDYSVGSPSVMYVANSPNATYGIDSLSPYYQEIGGPPASPAWDVRWVKLAIKDSSTFGNDGLVPLDMRGIPTNLTQKDTFKLQIAENDGGFQGSNVTIQWPSPSYLSARCDSIFLVSKNPAITDTNGNPIGTVNMMTNSSLLIFQPFQVGASFTLFVYKYGVHLQDTLSSPLPVPTVTEVKTIRNTVPTSFSLKQNYPNPFNPSTTFAFDIHTASVTDIAIYNLLGQKVSTLVSQQLMPGSYTATWNGLTSQGVAAGSGVYFVRMVTNATNGKGETFSAFRKIVLLK